MLSKDVSISVRLGNLQDNAYFSESKAANNVALLSMEIRPIHINDAAAVLSIYAPYVAETAISFESSVPTIPEIEERIETYTQKYPWLAAEEDGRIVGYAYASKHRDRDAYQWCVESSVYIERHYHGRGIAYALYTELFDRLTRMGFVNVYAGITQPNERSNKLHLKMGFEPVGVYKNIGYKLGQWHDVLWLVKTINEHVPHPQKPLLP